jgi:hypothetical protein
VTIKLTQEVMVIGDAFGDVVAHQFIHSEQNNMTSEWGMAQSCLCIGQ